MAGVRELPAGRCAVGVQQSKLADAAAAEEAKTYWAGRLAALKELLESA